MNDIKELRPYLSRLKLSGMLEILESRIKEALAEGWDHSRFLLTLLTDEAERRDQVGLNKRIPKRRSGIRRRPLRVSTSNGAPLPIKSDPRESLTASGSSAGKCIYPGPEWGGQKSLGSGLGARGMPKGV
jgi:hypothetical protein